MAYQSKDLSVLAYANGFTMWHYVTADTKETVQEPGYFDAACDMLRAKDMIVINAEDDNMMVFVKSVEDRIVTLT